MKILLKNPDGSNKIVYHQDRRIIDHYLEKIIDVIDDKITNNIKFQYEYTDKTLDWYDSPDVGLSEVVVTYFGIVPLEPPLHPSLDLKGNNESPEYCT